MREFGRPADNVPARGVSPNRQEVPNRGGRNRPAPASSRPDADPRRHDGVNADAGSLQRESAGSGLRAAVRDGFNTGDFSDAEARYRRPARDDFDVDETLYGGKSTSARARDDFDIDEALYGDPRGNTRGTGGGSEADEALYGAPRRKKHRRR